MSTLVVDFFKNHPSMKSVDSMDLARLSAVAVEKDVKDKQQVFSKGSAANNVYLVLSGNVEIKNGKEIVHKKEKGEFLGEEAVFDSNSYTLDAVAKGTKVKVLQIPKAAMLHLMDKYAYLSSYFFTSHNQKVDKKTADKITDSSQKIVIQGASSFKVLMSWVVAFLVPLVIYSSLGTTLPIETKLFLSILSAGIVLWTFNVLPDFVPALMVITSTLMMGLVPYDIILGGFSSSTFFLVFGIMGLSILVGNSGILYRLMLLLLRYLPQGSIWYNIGLFIIGTIMTPVVPSIINRTRVVTPLVEDLISLLGLKKKAVGATKLSASAFYGTTILSSIFFTGSIMNFVVIGFLPFKDKQFIESVGWIFAAGVAGIILLITHFVGSSIFFVSKEKVAISKDKIKQQLKVLGMLTPVEIQTVGTIFMFVLALVTLPYHKIPIHWITLFVLFALLSLKIVGHKQWLQQTDWSFLIFLGSIVGVSATLTYLQIDQLISAAVIPFVKTFLGADNITSIFSLLVLLTLAVRLLLPVGPTVIIMMALSFPLADSLGLSLWPFGFIVIMVCDIWFFPYQSPFYMSYVDSFEGRLPYDEKKFLMYNWMMNIGRIVALYLSLPYWKSLSII